MGTAEVLLAGVVVNVLIGNGDAHAKNFSLLHDPAGGFRLAPFYDLVSTLYYGDDRLAMHIDNVRRTNRVTGARILNEAAAWALPKDKASEIVTSILTRAPSALEAAREETPGLPEELAALVDAQLTRMRSGSDV